MATASSFPVPGPLTLAAVAVGSQLHAWPTLAHKPAFRVHALALARGAEALIDVWKRENLLAQTTLHVGRVQGKKSVPRGCCPLPSAGWKPPPHPPTRHTGGRKTRYHQESHRPRGNHQRAEAEGPGSFLVTHADQRTERMAVTEPSPMAPPQGHPNRAGESEQEG